MNKKIFLGAPFAGYINPETGTLYEDKKTMITTLIDYFISKGYSVENAHKRENWGKAWMEPEICTPLDFEQVKTSEYFVAMPGDPPSGGVHIELGWAAALDTKIILLLEEGKQYCNLVLGLGKVARVDYITYSSLKECVSKLEKIIT